jgi:hypothetical protein
MRNFRQIIDYWDTYADLALDIGSTAAAVKQMRRRDRIPSRYWLALVACSQQRGLKLTFAKLAELAAERGNQ